MTASLGLGTYRVRGVEQAARTACADGSVWIDAADYSDAHQALRPVISGHLRARVATKTSFQQAVRPSHCSRPQAAAGWLR
ncbi:Oxidoreductase OS=Streptomyces microflavus OX=1919 GN=Smic_52340 PE=4 SV=1 [Streptomyces microflavus]